MEKRYFFGILTSSIESVFSHYFSMLLVSFNVFYIYIYISFSSASSKRYNPLYLCIKKVLYIIKYNRIVIEFNNFTLDIRLIRKNV